MSQPSFAANRIFIDELVRWRRRLGLPAGSPEDRALAFLIEVCFRRHASAWRPALRALLEEASAHERPALVLALRASQFLLEELPGPFSPEVADFLARRHRARVQAYQAALAGGPSTPVHAVPEEMLPAWYPLAQPENSEFQQAYLSGP